MIHVNPENPLLLQDLCGPNNSVSMRTSNLFVQRKISRGKIQTENDVKLSRLYVCRDQVTDKLKEQRRNKHIFWEPFHSIVERVGPVWVLKS